MKAKGQARLEPPRNPGCVSTGFCLCAAGSGLHGVRGGGRLHGGGREQTTRGPFLLCRMRAALYLGCCVAPIGGALAFCLLLCCYVALPCPFTPSDPTDQRPSPLLMLKLCSCHCLKAWLAGIPVLWVLRHAVGHLRQPWDHGIEQGMNHLSVRDAR